MPTNNQIFGGKGESMAIRFLEEKGWQILERNFHKRAGEIDIIARDPEYNEIIFVEVKTRHGEQYGYPEEAVTKSKMYKMAKAAQLWLLKNRQTENKWRLDVISIEIKGGKPEFYHLKNISL